jgi:hypothetical protein
VTRDDNGIRRMLGSWVCWGALRVSRNAPKVLSGKDLFGTTRDDGGIGKDVGAGCHMCWEGCHVEKTHLKSPFQATRASKRQWGSTRALGKMAFRC